jgi:hypothetical protein
VTAADLRWILALVRPRLLARAATPLAAAGLDAGTARRGIAALTRALDDGRHRTRAELAAVVADAGLPATGQPFAMLLALAELDAVVCSGARRGNHATYALVDHRVPAARHALAHPDAVVELARRYFHSRGPATVADFVWWSGLAPADARASVDALRDTLVAHDHAGQTYWRADAPAPRATTPPRRRRASSRATRSASSRRSSSHGATWPRRSRPCSPTSRARRSS